MKIVLIQHHGFLNGSGGTEKICCFLANNFYANKHQIEIATNQEILGKPMFYLNENIRVKNIFNKQIIQKKLHEIYNYEGINPLCWLYHKFQKKRSKLYNKALLKKYNGIEGLYKFNLNERSKAWKVYIENCKPDIIITMSIGSLLEITYNNTLSVPIVNSVNGRPDYDFTDLLWYRSTFEMDLLFNSYKNLSGIQVLFESYKLYLPTTFNGIAQTIPNPVTQFDDFEIVNHYLEKESYTIVNIASLNSSCKQQHIAISLFSKIANKYPNWNMVFWGVGNDLKILESLVKELNLTERIFFKGFTKEPIEKLKEADLFIFPSKYEGFPLALTEAMSVGLPCLGFENCSGVNELITNDNNGFLAKDEEEMLNQLEKLIIDRELRAKIGRTAHESVRQYSETNVLNKWVEFILQFH